MPTYTNAVKSARMTATRDEVAGGTLVIQASNDDVLATFALTGAGGTVSTDTWTLAFDASTVQAGDTGTATKAEIRDSGGTAQITGLTVGTSGSDLTIDNTSINTGQNVTISSATIQHAS